MRNNSAWILLALCAAFTLSCSRKTEEKAAPESVVETVPDLFHVRLATTKGSIVLEVHKDWAPKGVERFYKLVKTGYYKDARFFRVVSNFVVQWGIHADPQTTQLWSQLRIPDDPVKQSNTRGTVTFATAGPDSRTTHVFINLKDNKRLDSQGFAPFATVSEGMDIVDKLYSGYGDAPPRGNGPRQQDIEKRGNEYLKKDFPRLDFIEKASIEP